MGRRRRRRLRQDKLWQHQRRRQPQPSGCLLNSLLVPLVVVLVLAAESSSLPELCNFVLLAPLGDSVERPTLDEKRSRPYGDGQTTPELNGQATFSYLAAAELALRHLREGDYSVVPELLKQQTDTQPCTDLPFSSVDVFDGFSTRYVRLELGGDEEGNRFFDEDRPACFVLGPFTDRAALSWSIWSFVSQTSIVAMGGAMAPHLTDPRAFPYSVRNDVRADDYAKVVVEYLIRYSQRKYVSLLYDSSDYVATGLVPHLQASAQQMRLNLFSHPFDETAASRDPHSSFRAKDTADSILTKDTDDECRSIGNDLEQALREIQARGYHTILVSIHQIGSHLAKLASIADRLGLVGPSYLWIFSRDSISTVFGLVRREEEDSPVDRLLRGAGVIHLVDGFAHHHHQPNGGEESQAFVEAWRSQDVSTVHRLNQQMPEASWSLPRSFLAPDNFFQSNHPAQYASFVYDAAMSMGLAACEAMSPLRDKQRQKLQLTKVSASHYSYENEEDRFGMGANSTGVEGDMVPFSPSREEMLQATQNILKKVASIDFHGASGRVRLNSKRGRDVDDVVFGMYNVRPGSINASDGTRGYEMALTAVRNSSGWHDVPGGENAFLFFDGTNDEPEPLRDVSNANYIPRRPRRVGLSLMGSLVLACLLGMAMAVICRHNPIVLDAHPLFLLLFCLASIILASAIWTVSQDESYGWEPRQLSWFCRGRLLTLTVGFVIKDISFHVKLYHNMEVCRACGDVGNVEERLFGTQGRMYVSTAALFLVNIIVALWVVGFPPTWTREVVTEFPLETAGDCSLSDRHGEFLLAVVGLLLVVSALFVSSALHQSHTTTKLLCDAKQIKVHWFLWGIGIQTQTMMVAVPLFSMLRGSPVETRHVGRVTLIWSLTMSGLAPILGPIFFRFFKATCLSAENRSHPRSPRRLLFQAANPFLSTGTHSCLSDARAQEPRPRGRAEEADEDSNSNNNKSSEENDVDEGVRETPTAHMSPTEGLYSEEDLVNGNDDIESGDEAKSRDNEPQEEGAGGTCDENEHFPPRTTLVADEEKVDCGSPLMPQQPSGPAETTDMEETTSQVKETLHTAQKELSKLEQEVKELQIEISKVDIDDGDST